jgi:hypothetical protein
MSYYGTEYHNREDDHDAVLSIDDKCEALAVEAEELIETFLEDFFAMDSYQALECCNMHQSMDSRRQVKDVLRAILATTNLRDDLVICVSPASTASAS